MCLRQGFFCLPLQTSVKILAVIKIVFESALLSYFFYNYLSLASTQFDDNQIAAEADVWKYVLIVAMLHNFLHVLMGSLLYVAAHKELHLALRRIAIWMALVYILYLIRLLIWTQTIAKDDFMTILYINIPVGCFVFYTVLCTYSYSIELRDKAPLSNPLSKGYDNLKV